MADSAATLLIRSGLLKPEQVASAHSLMQREGGSFGECLVRSGAIDESSLVEFYHKRLMIPRIPDGKLDYVPRRVLDLVTPDMAAEFRVLPCEIDGEGTLTLAMTDPSDNHAVDEVAFFADRFVVRAVASESAVRRAIERYYGVHFTSPRIGEQPKPLFSKKAPPKPTKEELDEQIVLLTRVKRSDQTPLPIPLPPPVDADEAGHAYIGEGTPEEPILLTQPLRQDEPEPEPPPREKRSTLPGFPSLAVPDPPLLRIRTAHHREEVSAAVLDYVAQLAGRVALFVIKKTSLVGWDTRGAMDASLVRQIEINLIGPSLFRDVVASRLPYRGPLPETAANIGFAQAIGGVADEILLMPIAIRDRIVAVVFADSEERPMPDAALHATTREAGLAYERLILESKR